MDHSQFDEKILAKATAAILKTRDGLLRAAVPSPIGSCTFLNDVSAKEMNDALRRHKQLMKSYPRNGKGLEAYVDSSDTGYTENAKMEEEKVLEAAAKRSGQLNGASGHIEAEVNEYSEKITSNGPAEHINTSTIKVVSWIIAKSLTVVITNIVSSLRSLPLLNIVA